MTSSLADIFRKAGEHHAKGEFAQALEGWDQVIALAPGEAQAFCNRGAALASLGRFPEALQSFDRAVSLKPNDAEFHFNRGMVQAALGRSAEAMQDYASAARLKPQFFEAHLRLGFGLFAAGRFEQAAASFGQAASLNPRAAAAHNGLGMAHGALGHHAQALESFDRAIACDANFADAWCNRSSSLKSLDRFDEALSGLDRALQINPDHVVAHSSRGNLLQMQMRFEEAAASYDHALVRDPNFAEAHNNRANALKELGRFDQALAGYTKAIALRPDYADAYMNKGLCLMLLGDFAGGWPLYEWRKKNAVITRKHAAREWQGQDLNGKTLLIEAEQGLGDTLEFCRYGAVLAARGAKVILSVQSSLVRLLGDIGPGITVIDAKSPPPAFDYHTTMLSLPLLCKTSLVNVPAAVPYIPVDAERAAHWKRKLGDHGFKIGIVWQGDRRSGVESGGRSLALRRFETLAKIPGVRLISLQKYGGEEQLADLPPGMVVETLGDDFDAGPDALLDTAAVMQSLDLVIAPDTAVNHLAGALGRPAWAALKRVPDWRWHLDRADSPWYPNTRLFRQSKAGDWGNVFDDMARELTRKLAGLVKP